MSLAPESAAAKAILTAYATIAAAPGPDSPVVLLKREWDLILADQRHIAEGKGYSAGYRAGKEASTGAIIALIRSAANA